MTTNMNSSVSELNLNEQEGVGGGYLREVWTEKCLGVYRINWQVINDKTGKVMITLDDSRNARAYARLMNQSTEELPLLKR